MFTFFIFKHPAACVTLLPSYYLDSEWKSSLSKTCTAQKFQDPFILLKLLRTPKPLKNLLWLYWIFVVALLAL